MRLSSVFFEFLLADRCEQDPKLLETERERKQQCRLARSVIFSGATFPCITLAEFSKWSQSGTYVDWWVDIEGRVFRNASMVSQ